MVASGQTTDVDPFNHGTTTLQYTPVSNTEQTHLAALLNEAWNIHATNISAISHTDKTSRNFRVETPTQTYLLKKSRISDPQTQDLIHRSIAYLHENGIKTPTIILPSCASSFYTTPEGIFCLYDFIDGEHFDGSCNQLESMALETARMHTVLATIPYAQDIQQTLGSVITHDQTLLERICFSAQSYGERTGFDTYALQILNVINQHSCPVIEIIKTLPTQTTHYDLHPHNVLFTHELASLLDFDSLHHSQRIRAVSFAMHRFARTCGAHTERQNDAGVDIRERAQKFIDTYLAHGTLTDKEIAALPAILQDEAIRRIIITLDHHYLRNNSCTAREVAKHVTLLEEARLFSF